VPPVVSVCRRCGSSAIQPRDAGRVIGNIQRRRFYRHRHSRLQHFGSQERCFYDATKASVWRVGDVYQRLYLSVALIFLRSFTQKQSINLHCDFTAVTKPVTSSKAIQNINFTVFYDFYRLLIAFTFKKKSQLNFNVDLFFVSKTIKRNNYVADSDIHNSKDV